MTKFEKLIELVDEFVDYVESYGDKVEELGIDYESFTDEEKALLYVKQMKLEKILAGKI